MRKKEIAVEKFMKGYNCCQAVACAYCEDIGIPERDMLRLTGRRWAPFTAGI